ncbi:MAG: hypothetical protein RH859_11120 [Longimicrobiales bacterium]
MTDRDGNEEIYVMDEATGAATNLTAHDATDYGYSWSPDRTALAFGALAPAQEGAEPTLQIFRLTSTPARRFSSRGWRGTTPTPSGRRTARA